MSESELLLRKLLWIRHGCEFGHLYGDDGEMQCNKCMIDFLRMDAKDIEASFKKLAIKSLKNIE